MEKAGKALYMIATVFNLGRLPVAPGTWGSLGGLLLCLVLHDYPVVYVAVFIGLFILGGISAGKVEAEEGVKDPSCVVIDEFACIFPVFFLIPLKPAYIFIGFLIYRLIDIVKIPPARSLERIKGGWGIMLDDLMAGIYTNLILQLIIFLKLF